MTTETNSPTTDSGPLTVVLVHGALTDASVWHEVVAELQDRGHIALAPALAMRSLAGDAADLHAFLRTLDGPILVVAHSYAGSVISDPDALTPSVSGLVFVAAFQPEAGESAGELNDRFPGSGLTPPNVVLREEPAGQGMYLRPERFAQVYAADVAPRTAAVMAAAQHPIDPAALAETFAQPATWHSLPSWALVATADHSIPTRALRFMAGRAGSNVVEIDSSHAVPVAHPAETATVIEDALTALTRSTTSTTAGATR
ncbi:alpha/beta fold hydrolase [Allobranchiibius sp. CTAmp26]|uniref:alpha/beta fold hydrolase n=1 Tax=Allobranchiibius sp. CTAmp26 TaxID=2815214 RepID=UPI001AA1ADCB|nr:alpha/beta hydrolase [Allobranchiibius sp. CTAmp26]MBO1756712.1 alpha/beta hydrolase [Allobranchiibius sp. CTAmp26]